MKDLVTWISLYISIVSCLIFSLGAAMTRDAAPRIIPTPQFKRFGEEVVRFEGESLTIFLKSTSPKEQLAGEIIRREMLQMTNESKRLQIHFTKDTQNVDSAGIYLVDWSLETPVKRSAELILDSEDLNILTDPNRSEQAYVIRSTSFPSRVWLIGQGSQGVLYAAVTFIQLMQTSPQGLELQTVHLRDYPDFRYRTAADWLLFAEINRWAYDWGDGKRAFVERIKRKLDFCLRFKINMVFFDGFGWNHEKFPGYADLMRELNRYARERGIKLLFAGYGANYNPRVVRPERNIGQVWYNRDSYPHGNIYSCFGENRPLGGSLGTCRGNDELNGLKAAELKRFVRSVEPGVLYVHHEDRGIGDPNLSYDSTNYELWKTWQNRCERCRNKWPDDSLISQEGGAGAVAHAFRYLLDAVRSVKNNDSGYDASKDCTVILISPGYNPFPTEPTDWENHLTFWTNVMSLLPEDEQLQVGFREVFPQQGTNLRWVDAYAERLGNLELNSRTFFFVLGGADLYSRSSFNYPFSATAAMNGIFLGAETVFNFSGAVFQEPLQVLNVEFSWNTRAPGHRIDETFEEVTSTYQALMRNQDLPPAIIGPDGILKQACRQIYGDRAGEAMFEYLNLYRSQPRVASTIDRNQRMETHYGQTIEEVYGDQIEALLPVVPERIYPTPLLWRLLTLKQESGGIEPDRRTQELLGILGLSQSEWQRRWAAVWREYAEVNRDATQLINRVLQTSDLRTEARPDIEYLLKCLVVGELFADLFSSYHELVALSQDNEPIRANLEVAQRKLVRLSDHLRENFTFDTVDPLGGDQAAWLETLLDLRHSLEDLAKN